MNKKQVSTSESSSPAEKPLSLRPLSTVDALRGLLATKPVKDEALMKRGKRQVSANRVKIRKKA